MTRVHACENRFYKFIAKYCLPLFGGPITARLLLALAGKTIVLDQTSA